jgi:hypothetical protein
MVATREGDEDPERVLCVGAPAVTTELLLHNEEFHSLYSSPSIITMIKSRRMRWAGQVARKTEKRNAYRILVGNPQGKRTVGRPRRRWVDNIRMDFREIGWDGVD